MDEVYDENRLFAVEVCFAQASRLLYCEPSNEEIAEQARERVFAGAPYGEDNERVCEGLKLIDSWLGDALCEIGEPSFEKRMDDLRREWFRLFVGAGTPDAPCWESFYREPNSTLFGSRTLKVRRQYRQHGLQIERLRSEPDDHLGLMLGFMSRLVDEEAEALGSKSESAVKKSVEEQDAFLSDHVLPWLAAWRYNVAEHAVSGYMKGVGELTFGLCERYARRFGISFDEESRAFMRKKSLVGRM